jgi:hypothetical protein
MVNKSDHIVAKTQTPCLLEYLKCEQRNNGHSTGIFSSKAAEWVTTVCVLVEACESIG